MGSLSPAATSQPPSDFDGTAIGWFGDRTTGSARASASGLWAGDLSGSVVVQLAPEVVIPIAELPDGSVLYRTALYSPDGRTSISVIDSEGRDEPRHVATITERFGIAPFLPGVVIHEVDERGIDGGVWLVPLDGDAIQVLARVENMDPSLGHLAVSDDGGAVAREVPHPDRELVHLQVSWSSELIAVPAGSQPVGFDAADCLIVMRYPERSLVRIDLTTLEEQQLVPGFVADAAVKPGARWLLALTGSQESLSAVNLATGRTLEVALEGKFWSLTGLGGDRYVILERSSVDDAGAGDRGMVHAVVDLEDGWLLYLPPWLDR